MTPESLEALLAPIAPERPSGADMLHSAACDEIRRMRKGDDPSLPQGEWGRELRSAQWPRVREICEGILRTQSKDLQVACWYSEALTHQEGLPGMTFGLQVLEELLSTFWDTLFPALDPSNLEERIAKLEWLDRELALVIQEIPLTSPKHGGYSRLKWEESRMVENLGIRDPEGKEEAIAEGKLSAEAFDKAVAASGQPFYLDLHHQLQMARTAFDRLERCVDLHFDHHAPSLEGIRTALESCLDLIQHAMNKSTISSSGCPQTPSAAFPQKARQPMTVQLSSPVLTDHPVQSRADAVQRLWEVASYYRHQEPHSPVGPLVERAARWSIMPLEEWLGRVIKDESTLGQLRELLDLQPEA